jgi:hypothetical protein
MTVQFGILAAMLAAWLMVVAGIGKRQLELRPRTRVRQQSRIGLRPKLRGVFSRRGTGSDWTGRDGRRKGW